eukprot:1215318-Rhodomonas_salina.3
MAALHPKRRARAPLFAALPTWVRNALCQYRTSPRASIAPIRHGSSGHRTGAHSSLDSKKSAGLLGNLWREQLSNVGKKEVSHGKSARKARKSPNTLVGTRR